MAKTTNPTPAGTGFAPVFAVVPWLVSKGFCVASGGSGVAVGGGATVAVATGAAVAAELAAAPVASDVDGWAEAGSCDATDDGDGSAVGGAAASVDELLRWLISTSAITMIATPASKASSEKIRFIVPSGRRITLA